MEFIFFYHIDVFGNTTIKRPKIPILASSEQKEEVLLALIDSGSDIIYIPLEIALLLNIPLSNQQQSVKGFGELQVVKTKISLTIGESPNAKILQNVEAYVGTYLLEAADIVLGKPFFEHFNVYLKFNENKIIITPSQ